MAKKKILLQVGHLNISKLTKDGLRSWRDVTALKKSTGASGEADFMSKIVPIIADLLTKTGNFEVTITDAIYHKDIYDKAYDLFVACHYDGGGTTSRCMIASPDPTANPKFITDKARAKAEDFIKVWKETYPELTGVTLNQSLVTINMTQYFGWDYIEENTPSVLVEHFNHTSPSDAKLKETPEKVAFADAVAIAKYFGYNLDMPETDLASTFPFDPTKKLPDEYWNFLNFNEAKGLPRTTSLDSFYKEYNKAVKAKEDAQASVNTDKIYTQVELDQKVEEALKPIKEGAEATLKDLKTTQEQEIKDLNTAHETEIKTLQDQILKLTNYDKSPTKEGIKEIARWGILYALGWAVTYGTDILIPQLNIDPSTKFIIMNAVAGFGRYLDKVKNEEYKEQKAVLNRTIALTDGKLDLKEAITTVAKGLLPF